MITQNKVTTLLALRLITIMILLASSWSAKAQNGTDSLIINVGKSQIIFLVRDKEDLETLKNYDLNQVLEKLSLELDADSTLTSGNGTVSDTTIVVEEAEEELVTDNRQVEDLEHWEERERSDEDEDRYSRRRRRGYSRHFFNLELGTNNYLEDGEFPDENNEPYAVRPWGSWYVGLVSVNQTYLGGSFLIEWGPSVTWYNFKFEDDAARIIDGDETTFILDPDTETNFEKSKLTVAYVNFSVVPMFMSRKDIRRNRSRRFYDKKDEDSGFRFGLGGYVGYRIDSYSKTVIREGGDKDKDRDKDSFNLSSLRYGLRAQIGFSGTDLFINYDLNELFNDNRGPKLNAFSIGLIL